MAVIRSRAVNAATAQTWDRARQVASSMVANAASFPGIRYYDMYVDESAYQLVNLAEYTDESAWRAWIDANRPLGAELMTLVDVVHMEAYGTLSEELSIAIAGYAGSTVFSELATTGGGS